MRGFPEFSLARQRSCCLRDTHCGEKALARPLDRDMSATAQVMSNSII